MIRTSRFATADARAAESECTIVVKRPRMKRSLALLLGNSRPT
jgi:hypothetical protein